VGFDVCSDLYIEDERAVTFLTPSLFRASVPLPATAPPGNYDVEVRLLANTVILPRADTSFELVKSGFGEDVGVVARDWSALYGPSTALLALAFGLTLNFIFRRTNTHATFPAFGACQVTRGITVARVVALSDTLPSYMGRSDLYGSTMDPRSPTSALLTGKESHPHTGFIISGRLAQRGHAR
jgi:hypothetical protein